MNGQLAITVNVGGISISKTITKSADHANIYGGSGGDVALAAGKTVSAWVKTDANTAACSLPGGHGYTDGNFDVFWDGGMRYGVPGLIVTNALSFDGGTGDDFPATATSGVVVCKPQTLNTAIDGDAIALLAMNATTRAHLLFKDSNADTIAAIELTADEPLIWHDTNGVTNPLTGDPITVCYASCGGAAAGVLTILSLEDATP